MKHIIVLFLLLPLLSCNQNSNNSDYSAFKMEEEVFDLTDTRINVSTNYVKVQKMLKTSKDLLRALNEGIITQEEYNTSNYLKYLDEKLDDWERLKNKYFFEADWQKICKCEWTKLTLDINQQIKWKKRLYLESMKS